MKPCDCKSIDDTKRYLTEQGISYNDHSLTVIPGYVLIKIPAVEIKIPMFHFKRFAEWYLEDQDGCPGCEHYGGMVSDCMAPSLTPCPKEQTTYQGEGDS